MTCDYIIHGENSPEGGLRISMPRKVETTFSYCVCNLINKFPSVFVHLERNVLASRHIRATTLLLSCSVTVTVARFLFALSCVFVHIQID